MFGISFGELLVIAAVALVVLGPERLPAVARTLGQLVRKFQALSHTLRAEFERELQQADLQALRQELETEREAMRREFDAAAREVRNELVAQPPSVDQPAASTAPRKADS